MRSVGWPLIQDDWYAINKMKFGHRNVEGRQGDHLQSREKGLEQIPLSLPSEAANTVNTLTWYFWLPGEKILLFKPVSLWYFVTIAKEYTWLECK
jgi:hypothetical protein